jgi:hypothetical protein
MAILYVFILVRLASDFYCRGLQDRIKPVLQGRKLEFRKIASQRRNVMFAYNMALRHRALVLVLVLLYSFLTSSLESGG